MVCHNVLMKIQLQVVHKDIISIVQKQHVLHVEKVQIYVHQKL